MAIAPTVPNRRVTIARAALATLHRLHSILRFTYVHLYFHPDKTSLAAFLVSELEASVETLFALTHLETRRPLAVLAEVGLQSMDAESVECVA